MKKSKAILATALLAFGVTTAGAMAQPYGGRDRDDDRYDRRHYSWGEDCREQRNQNGTTGAVIGAIAGGLLGAGVSHGNAGAAIGGVIIGGIAGNAIGRDVDCGNRRYAIRAYDDGFNGPIGREYGWRGEGGVYGSFVPVREYRRGRMVCRQFRTITYRHGERFVREGRACRERDGYWHTY